MTDNGMTELLLFCLATVGMTSIITQGIIFQPFRQYFGNWAERIREQREQKAQAVSTNPHRSRVEWFNDLINCAQCTGFWCGLFCGSLFVLPYSSFDNDILVFYYLLRCLCYGLAGSFVAALGCNFIDWVFYRKMNALRLLEEQDLALAERQNHI